MMINVFDLFSFVAGSWTVDFTFFVFFIMTAVLKAEFVLRAMAKAAFLSLILELVVALRG